MRTIELTDDEELQLGLCLDLLLYDLDQTDNQVRATDIAEISDVLRQLYKKLTGRDFDPNRLRGSQAWPPRTRKPAA